MRKLRTLIVEDSADDAELIARTLRRGEYDVSFERVERPEAMGTALASTWDIVIADYAMPHFNGMEALRMVREKSSDLPFVLVSGVAGEELAVGAMRAGANDFILKDKLARLCPVVGRELNDAEARRARRKIESRYLNLFNSAPVGIMFVTADWHIINANQLLIRMLGLEGEVNAQLLETEAPKASSGGSQIDFRHVVSAADILRFEGLVARARYGAAQEDIGLVALDGRNLAVRISAGLPKDDTDPQCVAVVDISELRQAQELAINSVRELADARAKMVAHLAQKNVELVAAREAALQASQAKSQFLAKMSHEIRTPLSSLLGLTAILLETDLTPDQLELGREVQENGESLLKIINDILDFSKISAGKLVFRYGIFELQKAVDDAFHRILGDAHRKGLTTSVAIEPGIPQTLQGDAARLAQVLTNLLGNAVKFTEQGGISLTVSKVAETPEQLDLRFEITDTGIGIAEEAQADLFQPFSQLESSNSGTGLGLAIVRELVERMGGKVGVNSTLALGSTFWFTAKFDKAGPVSAAGADHAGQSITRHVAPDHSKRRILVVEDNAANRKVTLWQLNKLGYSAETAVNGSEALEALSHSSYDLVLMDCRMPVMDGYEASRRVRQKEAAGHHVKIIAMTAHALSGDQRKCLDAGMDDYICKPFKVEQLSEVITRHLGVEPSVPSLEPCPATSSENPSCEEAALDPVMMASLRAQNGLLPNLIETVTKEVPETLERIDQALVRANSHEAAIGAHALNGTAGIFGAHRMQQCALKVERAADGGFMDEARAGVIRLRQESNRLLKELSLEQSRPRTTSDRPHKGP